MNEKLELEVMIVDINSFSGGLTATDFSETLLELSMPRLIANIDLAH